MSEWGEGRNIGTGAVKRRYLPSGYAQEKAVVFEASESSGPEDDKRSIMILKVRGTLEMFRPVNPSVCRDHRSCKEYILEWKATDKPVVYGTGCELFSILLVVVSGGQQLGADSDVIIVI